jgi:hypothetical protein
MPATQSEFRKPELREIKFPWEPDGTVTEHGVHAETMMVVIGALAGFAAQTAACEALKRTQGQAAKDGVAIVVVTADTGEKFYFGDLINGYLVPQGTSEYPVWGLVAAAAIQAGVPGAELPDCNEMFRYVAGSIGKPEFGIPRTPANHPIHLRPRQALELFWPRVKFILSRTDGPGPAKGHSVAPEHWPIVAALVARQLVAMAKNTLDPRLSVALIMESAIAMSKVDPKSVPQVLPEKS